MIEAVLVQTERCVDNLRMYQLPHDTSSLFRGRHFNHTVIILCVRWYITYKLSYRDLVDMMAERGVDVSHTRESIRLPTRRMFLMLSSEVISG